MNMILGIIVLYLNGGLSGAHVVGAYSNTDECRAKVAEAVKANIPKDALPDGSEVYVLCFDTTQPKAGADHRASTPKPPSTSL